MKHPLSEAQVQAYHQYFPTHVKFIAEQNPNFQIYLARGKDRAGNPYSDPAKVYPPAGVIP